MERCDECPYFKLQHAIDKTEAGKILRPILDLDFKLSVGISVPDSKVDYIDLQLLRLLRSERSAREAELDQRRRNA